MRPLSPAVHGITSTSHHKEEENSERNVGK
jgi:hypothetical protein